MTDHFQDKAQEWDGRSDIQQLSQAVGSAIQNAVTLDSQMQIMDFGAGTGLICAQLAPHVAQVHAVDVSEAMLEKLAQKESLKDKVTTHCQDILEHPLSQHFDVIVSAMALHHVQDTDALLRRFYELSTPGAQLALADLDAEDGDFHPEHTDGVYHSGFERSALQKKLEAAGFQNVGFTTAHHMQKNNKDYTIFLVTAEK